MNIRDEIKIYLCIDNLKNGGYSSGTSVPYKNTKYRGLPPPPREAVHRLELKLAAPGLK